MNLIVRMRMYIIIQVTVYIMQSTISYFVL